MRLGRWSRTATQNSDSPPDGAPENWAPSAVNNWGRELMARVREWYQAPEWVDLISENLAAWPTITRVNDTTLKIAGADHTALFTANRRVKVVDASTSIYGFVASSALNGSDTDVVVTYDGAGVTPTTPTEVWLAPVAFGTAAYKNQGAGSGLDADTVDGIHASALAANFGKNFIIDGRFNLWDEATSFTSPATKYSANMWWVDVSAGGVGAVSRQAFTLGQTAVPNEPIYYMRFQLTTGGSAPVIKHRVEDVRSAGGQVVVFSAYMKADASRSVTPSVIQNFGTGGSAAVTAVTGTWNLTTTWQRFEITGTMPSMSGKTLGTNHHLELKLALPAGSTFTIDVTDVQLEVGATATTIDLRPLVTERSLASRYFQIMKEGSDSALIADGFTDSGTSDAYAYVSYPDGRMRIAPTVTFSAASTFQNDAGPAGADDLTDITAASVGPRGFRLKATRSSTYSGAFGMGTWFKASSAGSITFDARLPNI